MSYSDIPEELRLIPQWICWRYEQVDNAPKPTKVPYNPKNNQLADVSDPKTFASFDDCVAAVSRFSGIGFVFTGSDPYTFIDLDDTGGEAIATERQLKVYHEFDSWSEISPSGKGLHIIVKGSVPSGRRRSYIEVYSEKRYATFTGNVYNRKPIAERQELLTDLWQQMGGVQNKIVFGGDQTQKYSDEEIYRQAISAANGGKFYALFEGKWQNNYPSQSEADYALIDILSFYTQNPDQIQRIFAASELGKRNKAKRQDYIKGMINKSFDRQLPPIDFDGLQNAIEEKLARTKPSDKVNGHPILKPSKAFKRQEVRLPPGFMGDVARFIYEAAPRPVMEVALAGAIALMAGICGRAYNVSATGLNQYVMLLANTGIGKEASTSGITKLMGTVKTSVPESPKFIGPSEIASAQALVRYLNSTSQCFVSLLGEIGLWLQQICGHTANNHEIGMRRLLLNLYNKSGATDVYQPTVYSDKEKNIYATQSPNFSLYGESTPERFYNALSEDMISEGLLPRFFIIEYNGPRPPLNKNFASVQVPFWLIDQLRDLCAQCVGVSARSIKEDKQRAINVPSNPQAEELFDKFNAYADDQVNNSTQEIIRQLWNRAHVKALKLAALVAVGCNFYDPVITVEHADWAIEMVVNDIRSLSSKFDAGEIGQMTSEVRQSNELTRVVKEFFTRPWSEVSKYCNGKDNEKLYNAKVIPYSYFNTRAGRLGAFQKDKMGSTIALKRAIQNFVDSGKLIEVTRDKKYIERFGSGQRAFTVNAKLLEEPELDQQQ